MQSVRMAAIVTTIVGSAFLSVGTISASPLATAGSANALAAASSHIGDVVSVQGDRNKTGGGSKSGGAKTGGGSKSGVTGARTGGSPSGARPGSGRAGGGNRVGNRGGGGHGHGHGFNPGAAAAVGIIGGVVGAIAIDSQRKAAIRECQRSYGRAYDPETGMVYLRGDQFPCP